MYNAQALVNAIKLRAKEKNIRVKDMLGDCELNINTLSQMTDKKGISSFALARIADYLDCSVDYLLGRTTDPHSHLRADNATSFASRLRLAMVKSELDVKELYKKILKVTGGDSAVTPFTIMNYLQGIRTPLQSNSDADVMATALGVSRRWLDGSEIAAWDDEDMLKEVLFPEGVDFTPERWMAVKRHIEMLDNNGSESALGVTDDGEITLLAAAMSDDQKEITKKQMSQNKWDIIKNAPETKDTLI